MIAKHISVKYKPCSRKKHFKLHLKSICDQIPINFSTKMLTANRFTKSFFE